MHEGRTHPGKASSPKLKTGDRLWAMPRMPLHHPTPCAPPVQALGMRTSSMSSSSSCCCCHAHVLPHSCTHTCSSFPPSPPELNMKGSSSKAPPPLPPAPTGAGHLVRLLITTPCVPLYLVVSFSLCPVPHPTARRGPASWAVPIPTRQVEDGAVRPAALPRQPRARQFLGQARDQWCVCVCVATLLLFLSLSYSLTLPP